jgi:hypothetical protein
MEDENGEFIDLKELEKQEHKEEATADASRQQYVLDSGDLSGMSTVNEQGDFEEDIPDAAVVGVDDMDTYGE